MISDNEWNNIVESNLDKKIAKAIENKEEDWIWIKNLSEEEFIKLYGIGAKEKLENSITTNSLSPNQYIIQVPMGLKGISFNHDNFFTDYSKIIKDFNKDDLIIFVFNLFILAEKSISIYETFHSYELIENQEKEFSIPLEFREILLNAKNFLFACFSSKPNNEKNIIHLISDLKEIILWLHGCKDKIIFDEYDRI